MNVRSLVFLTAFFLVSLALTPLLGCHDLHRRSRSSWHDGNRNGDFDRQHDDDHSRHDNDRDDWRRY